MLRSSRTSPVVFSCYFHTSNMRHWGAFTYLFWTLVSSDELANISNCDLFSFKYFHPSYAMNKISLKLFVLLQCLMILANQELRASSTAILLETRHELLQENRDGFQRFLDGAKAFFISAEVIRGKPSEAQVRLAMEKAVSIVEIVIETMPGKENEKRILLDTVRTASIGLAAGVILDIQIIPDEESIKSLAFAIAEEVLFKIAEGERYSEDQEFAIKSLVSGTLNILRLKDSVGGFSEARHPSDLPVAAVEVIENGYLLVKTAGVDIGLSIFGIEIALTEYRALLNNNVDTAHQARVQYFNGKGKILTIIDSLPGSWNSTSTSPADKRKLALNAASAFSAIQNFETITKIGLFNGADGSLRNDWALFLKEIKARKNIIGEIFASFISAEQFLVLADTVARRTPRIEISSPTTFPVVFQGGNSLVLEFLLSSEERPRGDASADYRVERFGSEGWIDVGSQFVRSDPSVSVSLVKSELSSVDAGQYRIRSWTSLPSDAGRLVGETKEFEMIFSALDQDSQFTDLKISTAENSSQLVGGFGYTFVAIATDSRGNSVEKSVLWKNDSESFHISPTGSILVPHVNSPISITVRATLLQDTGDLDGVGIFTIVPSRGMIGQNVSNETENTNNGSFESGLDGWVSSGAFQADSRFSNARTGTEYAYLAQSSGLPGNNLVGSVRQEFSIPASADSAELEFYLSISSEEVDNAANDIMNVQILGTQGEPNQILRAYSELDATSAYRKHTFNISQWIGKTFTLQFFGTTNDNFPTVFRIDDVSVKHQELPDSPLSLSLTITGPSSIDESSSENYSASVTDSTGQQRSVTVVWSENSSSLSVSSSGRLTASSVSSNRSGTLTATYRQGSETLTAAKTITIIDEAESAGGSGFRMNVTKNNGSVIRRPHHSTYQPGTEVRLTARPDDGFIFAGWQGDVSGTDNRIFVTMDSTKIVTAVFTPIPPGTGSLTVNITPPEAVAAGARWRIDGGAWQSSGLSLSTVLEGPHFLEFESVAGWTAPSVREVNVNPSTGNSATGTYQSANGSPVVRAISPFSGSLSGGTEVTISGSNLSSVSNITFGSFDASIVSRNSDQIVVTTPPSSAFGSVDVAITSPSGTISRPADYTYQELDQFNFRVLDQLGGSIGAVTLEGSTAFYGEGPSFVILDVANPSAPQERGRVRTPGVIRNIQISGSLAYVCCGRKGVAVIDISNVAQPRVLSVFEPGGFAQSATIQGSYLYVSAGLEGLIVLNIDNPVRPALASRLKLPASTTELAYLQSGFRKYAILSEGGGGQPRLWTVEVTDPNSPILSSTVQPLNGQSTIIESMAVDDDLLLTGELGGVRVWDFANPSAPVAGELELGRGGKVTKSGNEIVGINTNGVDTRSLSGRTNLSNLSRESLPSDLGFYRTAAASSSLIAIVDSSVGLSFFSHSQFRNLSNRGAIGLRIDGSNVTSIGNTVVTASSGFLSTLSKQQDNLSFNSSFLFDQAGGSQGALATYTNTVVEVDNGEEVRLIKLNSNGSLSIASIWKDVTTGGRKESFFFDVMVDGHHAYVVGGREQQAGLNTGRLIILDIRNASNPLVVAALDGPPGFSFNSVNRSGDLLICSGFSGGAVVDVSQVSSPRIVNSTAISGNTFSSIRDQFIYIGSDSGLKIYSLADPSSPVLIETILTSENIQRVEFDGDLLYAQAGSAKVYAMQVGSDGIPEVIGSLVTGGFVQGFHAANQQLFIADGSGGLVLAEVVDKEKPEILVTEPGGTNLSTDRSVISLSGLASDDKELRAIEWTTSVR